MTRETKIKTASNTTISEERTTLRAKSERVWRFCLQAFGDSRTCFGKLQLQRVPLPWIGRGLLSRSSRCVFYCSAPEPICTSSPSIAEPCGNAKCPGRLGWDECREDMVMVEVAAVVAASPCACAGGSSMGGGGIQNPRGQAYVKIRHSWGPWPRAAGSRGGAATTSLPSYSSEKRRLPPPVAPAEEESDEKKKKHTHTKPPISAKGETLKGKHKNEKIFFYFAA